MKSYSQICGIARALDLIGDRWTILILRDLLLGPLHYAELLRNLEGITSNLLASRLTHLVAHGLVERQGRQKQAPYALTPAGLTVEPVLFALGAWGWSFLDLRDPTATRNLRWALVSLKRRLRPLHRDYILQLHSTDQGGYTICERQGKIYIEAQTTLHFDAMLRGASRDLLQSFADLNETPWESLAVTIEGDRKVWSRLMRHLKEASSP